MIGDVDSPPSVEVVRTKTAELWLGEDGILRVRCLPGSVHTIHEARENVNALRHRLMKKVPYCAPGLQLRGRGDRLAERVPVG